MKFDKVHNDKVPISVKRSTVGLGLSNRKDNAVFSKTLSDTFSRLALTVLPIRIALGLDVSFATGPIFKNCCPLLVSYTHAHTHKTWQNMVPVENI